MTQCFHFFRCLENFLRLAVRHDLIVGPKAEGVMQGIREIGTSVGGDVTLARYFEKVHIAEFAKYL